MTAKRSLWMPLLAVAALMVLAEPACFAYHMRMQLRHAETPTGTAMAGMQIRFNEVPVRPLSAIMGSIPFSVGPDRRTGASCRIDLGLIPKGAQIIGAVVAVNTAFDAGTTNVLAVGTLTAPEQVVATADVNEAAAGTTLVCHNPVALLAADTRYYIRYTQTGAAATTGAATVILLYAIP